MSRIGALRLLREIFGTVVITNVIAEEFGEQIPEWIKVREAENTNYRQLLEATLDSGEASAIALAIELDGVLLVVDDLKARKEAIRLGLKIIGTLGILYKGKVTGLIPFIKPYLDKLQQEGFRIAPKIVTELLNRAGEAEGVL